MQDPTELAPESPPAAYPWRFLTLLTLLVLPLRLWLMSRIPVIETDGAVYARLAQEMVTHAGTGGFHTAWPPFYPRMIAILAVTLKTLVPFLGHKTAPELFELSGRLVNVLLGSIIPWLTYVLGRRIGGHRVGLVAAVLTALHPRLLTFSVQVLTEMPFSLFCTVFLVLLGPFFEPKGRRDLPTAILAGLTAAACYLTRPEGFILFPFGVAAVLLSQRALKSRLTIAAAFAATFLLAAAPYTISVSRAVGGFCIGAKGDYNLTMAYAGQPGVASFDRTKSVYNNFLVTKPGEGPFQPEPIPRFRFPNYVLHHPDVVAKHFFKTFPESFYGLPSLAYPLYFLITLARMFRRRRPTKHEILWLAFWGTLIGLYALIFVYRRFFIATVPVLVVEAAMGLTLLTDRHKKVEIGVVAALCLYGIVVAGLAVTKEDYATEEVTILKPGSETAAVMSRKPFVAYYSGASILAMPEAGPDTMHAEARRRGATHVVIDEQYLVDERPDYAPFLTCDKNLIPDWTIAACTERPKHRVVLYEIAPR